MSHPYDAPGDAPATALRRSFERARTLSLENQIEECVDQLQNPGLLAALVLDAYRVMESCFASEQPPSLAEIPHPQTSEDSRVPTLVEEFIWPTRELSVARDNCSFTCLATNVNPLPTDSADPNGLSAGLDYVGLTCCAEGRLVLGAVQAPGDATAYPLLLRALACLTEIAPAPQLQRLDREYFKGIAGDSPRFDLNLVLWDGDYDLDTSAISQLTRDLAEKVKAGVLAGADFPTLLGDIVCLQLNADRFDGRMRFAWRIS